MTREEMLYNKYKECWIDKEAYRICYDINLKKGIPFSHFVWNLYHPNDLIVKGDGHCVHHEDENKLNDHPYNLKKKLSK